MNSAPRSLQDASPSPRRERVKVLIVGYSPTIRGGVTAVTARLAKSVSGTTLLVALKYYNPIWKQAVYTLFAYCRFPVCVLRLRPRIVQILIGSRGDLVRNIYYIVLSKLLLRKVVVQFHKNADAMLHNLPRALKSVIRFGFRFVDRFCFLSRQLRDEMRDLCGNTPNTVIPNPVPPGYLETSPLSRSERTGDIVFLGRWSPEKGVDDLTSAMRELWQSNTLRCNCYGGTPKKNPHPGIFFGGWIEGTEKHEVLRRATILLLPSYAEAYPITLLEAAACGTPFVATDVGGVGDIVRESGGGILVPVGDVDALVSAVRSLLTDADTWERCSRNGRHWSESQDEATVAVAWKRMYNELDVEVLHDLPGDVSRTGLGTSNDRT